MSVTYKNNEIKISSSEQKFNVDVVYARPEDIIKLDFTLDDLKITFVNGDLDIVFPNGSVISLASYGTLAFDDNAPKIYDANGNLITLEILLQKVQVLKPEDSILILANRDKHQLVQNEAQVNKIIMAHDTTSAEDASGVPITAVGDVPIKTKGVISNLIDPAGTSFNYNLNKGMGDYQANRYTTFLTGNTDTDNKLPGNTFKEEEPKLVYKFLFGDTGIRGASRTINGQAADYYGVKFGDGENKDSKVQLNLINMNELGGNYQNKIFDAHAFDGIIKRLLHLDYSGGVFPQSVIISGIPKDVDASGQKCFDLIMVSGGSTKLNYDSTRNMYYVTQLDPGGKIKLKFIFKDSIPDQNLVIKYTIVYFDPRTAAQKVVESTQDVGIRRVSQESDLNLNSVVLNKGASGLLVDADKAGTGNKIFIGGNVKNKFSSCAGDSLVFLGVGSDIIDLASGNNLIYGSTGYHCITGSGNNGINWLVFSSNKEYNNTKYFNNPNCLEHNVNKPFMQSDAIKDDYYTTLKKGISLQFYLGVPVDDVLELWDKLGITGDVGGLKSKVTSNFVRAFSSITVIGDRGNTISITNIVASKELDIFNLYFKGVVQKVNLYSDKKNISGITNQMILHTMKGNPVTIDYGRSEMDIVTSGDGASYFFQACYFKRFTVKGSGDFTVILAYGNANQVYREAVNSSAYFIGGEGKNTANFSGIKFESATGCIEFEADSRYNSLTYRCVKGKNVDYFQNFNEIIGSKGDDKFYGSTNSKGIFFDGHAGNNTLTYERSVGGVTFDALECKIYKINSKNIEDYNKYKATADQFSNIKKIILSGLSNVILGAGNNHIGNNFELYLGNADNTIRYDYDTNITSIEVFSDDLKVKKDGSDNRLDIFKQSNSYGTIEYIGTKGANLFHGGVKYSNIFNGGNGANNTLSYQEYLTNKSYIITVDLFRNTVFKAGKTDTYINIQKIIGGAGNDIFTLGNMDPTKHIGKINGISIDGGGGKNIFRFNSVDISNLSKDNFALVFDVDTGGVKFYDKNDKEIFLSIDLTKNISTIYGTLAKNKFIASEKKDFHFDGSWLINQFKPSETKAYANTLDYSNFKDNLTVDLTKGVVKKGENQQDNFRNIQSFITGKGDDTFLSIYSLEWQLLIFDGNAGKNTLEYQNTSVNIAFDFLQGTIIFNQQASGVKHYFMNITSFFGGGGENTFKLYDGSLPFLSEKREEGVIISIGSKVKNSRTIIDFDNWSVAIGTEEKQFEINDGIGQASNGKEGKDSIIYKWENARGFVGSKKGSYFVIVDKKEGVQASGISFKLDGNKDAEKSVLDYSGLKVDNLKLELNISDGSLLKFTKTTVARDTILNFKYLKLSNYDDTVKITDSVKDNLKNLQLVDGMGGNNTLDFSMLSKDVDVEVTKQGLSLSKLESLNITFVHFVKMFATKGNTTFRVTDNSRGANIEIYGNTNLCNNKYTILDLTAIKNLEYWNWVSEDKPKDPSNIGKLIWNNILEPITYIKAISISQVKIGDGNNIIHGSLYNHTHYIGSKGEGTSNLIDYSDITKETLTVTINGDKQTVWFNYLRAKDDLTNFNYFKTTTGNDTFVIASLENLNSIILDGFAGENTLSFGSLNKSIELDISTEELKVEKSTLKIIKIQHLVLSQNNDTVIISNPDKKELTFKTIDGHKGTNTIDIRDGSTIIFNEKNDNKLLLSKHNEIKISNIYHLKTNTIAGNRFYNNYNISMKVEVVGITEDKGVSNLLSYKNLPGIKINFSTAEVYKVNNKSIDKFSGINYFEGSALYVNTFYLAKSLGSSSGSDSNKALKTIYINIDPKNPENTNQNKDIINISQAGDNAILYVAKQQLEGSEIQYKWINIGTFSFTNNQTIYVSFDENFKYQGLEGAEKNNNSSNLTLVFSNKEGKGGKEYKDGYIIVDTMIETAQTYDASGKNLANINFSNISVIKGTGSNKDVFYGSIFNIDYYSSDAVKKGTLYKINEIDGTYGSGTLSYQKFLTECGMKFVFNVDNSASITENTTAVSKKLDKAYGISRYIGSMKDDSFVIAKNKNAGKIILDGNGGLFNNIDFSQTAGDKGIELDTTTGVSLGDFDYIFKNITTFKLTNHNDTLLGSLDNIGFLNKDSKENSTDIIVDANGGTDNTIDYTKYLKGTQDNIIKVNADLHLATITKEGKNKNGALVYSNDIIAIFDWTTYQTKINFQKIILNGEYVRNTLVVSGREADNKIYVEIKNPTEGIIQLINFEFINHKIDMIWDGQGISNKHTNIILINLNGKHLSFIGFNSFTLSKLDSTLTIKENANLIKKGGKLDGGGGKNTLIIDNNKNKNSSVVVNTNHETITINLKGEQDCVYGILNFHTFYLGCMSNKFLSIDYSYYTIIFTNKDAFNEINFTSLHSTYLVLDFKQITNDGANIVISKEDITSGKLIGRDTIFNAKTLVLTNQNDTVELVEGEKNVDNKITIDGAGGINTISFRKWDKEVDLSKINDKGNIEIGNYILKKFTEIILRDKDDEISLNEKSKFNIDGGGGNNKVTYTGNFIIGDQIGGVVIQEFESIKQGGAIINGTRVSKGGGNVDSLLRFNYFILPSNCNNVYIPIFVNTSANNPNQYTIDFNWTKQKEGKLNNIMDYSKLVGAKAGIRAKLDSSRIDNLEVDVFRDDSKIGYNAPSTCIRDKLLKVGHINGSSNGGDTFEISGIYNTYCTINASGKLASTIVLLSENSKREKDNTTIWNLTDNVQTITNTSQEHYYLRFKGNITNILVKSKPKNNRIIDQEFIISNFNIAYNIIYKIEGTISDTFSYAKLNLQNIRNDKGIVIKISQIANQADIQFVKIEVNAKSSNDNKTLRIFGTDYILGSSFTQNVFEINHEGISNNPKRNIYIVGNRNRNNTPDSLLIKGGNFLKVVHMNTDETFGGVRIVTEGGKQASYSIKYVNLFSVENTEFVFNVINSPIHKGISYNFFINENSKFFVNISKDVTDFSAILDKNGLYFNSNKLGLSFVANKIDKVTTGGSVTDIPIIIKSPDKNINYVFDIFNILDFTQYIPLKNQFNICNTPDTGRWSITIDKLTFNGKSNVSPTIYMPSFIDKQQLPLINIDLTYKGANLSLFDKLDIYTLNHRINYNIKFNSDKDLYNNIILKDKFLSIVTQYGSVSTATKGSIFVHNFSGGQSIIFSSASNIIYNFDINITKDMSARTNFMFDSLKNIKGLYINIMSPLCQYVTIEPTTILFHDSIRDSGFRRYNIFIGSTENQLLLSVNGPLVFTLLNGTTVDWKHSLFMKDYIELLGQGKILGAFHIKPQKSSDNDSVVNLHDIRDLVLAEDFTDPYYKLEITLDTHGYRKLDFILNSVTNMNNNKTFKPDFKWSNVVMSNIVIGSGGLWNPNTHYTVTNANNMLTLGHQYFNPKSEHEKVSTSVVYSGKNSSDIDLQGGSIDLALCYTMHLRYSVSGFVNGYSFLAMNINTFNFNNIINCKSFSFSCYAHHLRDQYERHISANVWVAPKLSPEKMVIKKPSDLTNFMDNKLDFTFSDVYSDVKAYIYYFHIGKQATVTAEYTKTHKTTQILVVSNITKFLLSLPIPEQPEIYFSINYKETQDQSFIINFTTISPKAFTLVYKNIDGKNISYTKGVVEKLNSKNEKIYDLVSGFASISFQKAQAVNILITKDLSPFDSYFHDKNTPSNVVIEGDNVTKLFVNLEDISCSYNNTVIHMNNIKDLHFTLNKTSTYNVFFVKNNEYCNKYNSMSYFDTNGYFVIFDNNTKMKMYCTGNNIEKFGKVFEGVAQQYIKVLNNYQELISVIKDPSLKTDILISDNMWHVDDTDITISYENNNHSFNNIFFDEEDEDKEETDKTSEDFNSIYQEIQTQEQYNESVNHHNTDNELNILSEEENGNSIFNIEAVDVLEFTSDDIDTILNSSFNNFLENNNIVESTDTINGAEKDIHNQEDTEDFLDAIKEISSVENMNIDNYKNNALFISETIIDTDPSAKIEDSMNKQNTLTGNNFK